MTDPVEHLARLAGIDLDPSEHELLARHLAALQTLIDALPGEGADTGNPNAPDLPLREDRTTEPLPTGDAAAIMPRCEGGWLDLPPVREDEA